MLARYIDVMAKQHESDSLFRSYGSLFEDFFGRRTTRVDTSLDAPVGLRSYRTSSDKDGNMTLEVDLPGVATKDVTLWVTDDQVVLEARRGEQKFTNRYTIDSRYDPQTATASMAHGLLKVSIKPTPSRKMRQVDITQA